MKRFVAGLAVLALASGAYSDPMQTDDLVIHSDVDFVQGFVVSPMGPAVNRPSAAFELATSRSNLAPIASVSGVYNGTQAWSVTVTSANDFVLRDPDESNTGFRYGVVWTGDSSQGKVGKVGMGYSIRPDGVPDPDDSSQWVKAADRAGTMTITNGRGRAAGREGGGNRTYPSGSARMSEFSAASEYNGMMEVQVHGGQQWQQGSYSDVLTVTFGAY